jgi:hypothetical protein
MNEDALIGGTGETARSEREGEEGGDSQLLTYHFHAYQGGF